jgi:anti-anti-sigma factor
MQPGRNFELHERTEDGCLCVKPTGELDLATAPRLDDRLRQLRAENRRVRLDLSELEFMDSTGLRVLIEAANAGRGWQFEVQPDLSPQVRRLFQFMGVEHFILGDHRGPMSAAPTSSGAARPLRVV